MSHHQSLDIATCVMAMPHNGDRILVLKQNWLALVLADNKTMEVRGKRLKAGAAYFGWKGKIYASATLGDAVEIRDAHQWESLRHLHRVPGNVLPYKRTFGLPLHSIECLSPPIQFHHPKGAIGIVKYRA